MTVAYARRGLLAVYTPQANTTVEPELALMMPAGMAWLNARMTSQKPTIPDRLGHYMDQFPALLEQFANAPIDAVAIACTGASYLLGIEREEALMAEIAAVAGVPAFTGATASCAALTALGAKRIAMISPYNSALDQHSAPYWAARGFTVVTERNTYRDTEDFHPIYALDAQAALRATEGLEDSDIDAVLMLGTGMPTLDAIAARPYVGKAPMLSSMLCLGWQFHALRDPDYAGRDGLLKWVEGGEWKARLAGLRRAGA